MSHHHVDPHPSSIPMSHTFNRSRIAMQYNGYFKGTPTVSDLKLTSLSVSHLKATLRHFKANHDATISIKGKKADLLMRLKAIFAVFIAPREPSEALERCFKPLLDDNLDRQPLREALAKQLAETIAESPNSPVLSVISSPIFFHTKKSTDIVKSQLETLLTKVLAANPTLAKVGAELRADLTTFPASQLAVPILAAPQLQPAPKPAAKATQSASVATSTAATSTAATSTAATTTTTTTSPPLRKVKREPAPLLSEYESLVQTQPLAGWEGLACNQLVAMGFERVESLKGVRKAFGDAGGQLFESIVDDAMLCIITEKEEASEALVMDMARIVSEEVRAGSKFGARRAQPNATSEERVRKAVVFEGGERIARS